MQHNRAQFLPAFCDYGTRVGSHSGSYKSFTNYQQVFLFNNIFSTTYQSPPRPPSFEPFGLSHIPTTFWSRHWGPPHYTVRTLHGMDIVSAVGQSCGFQLKPILRASSQRVFFSFHARRRTMTELRAQSSGIVSLETCATRDSYARPTYA